MANNLFVSGNYAYVTDIYSKEGIRIIDITNPSNPSIVGSYNSGALGIFINGNYAYCAAYIDGLLILDVSDPTSPWLVGSYNPYSYSFISAEDVYVSGSYAYVAFGEAGLEIIDISNPEFPKSVWGDDINIDGSSIDIFGAGNYVYIIDDEVGLAIIDISDPSSPTLVGSYDTQGMAQCVHVSGNYAYVGDASGELKIIEISNPTSPALVGSFTAYDVGGVYVNDKYAYLADGANGLTIIDVSNPASPTLVGSYDTPGYARDVYVAGNYIYLADGFSGKLIIFEISEESLQLNSPNGEEEWLVGSTHDITWTSSPSIPNIKLEYSIDNGTTWITITSSTSNDGVCEWIVPNTPSLNCMVKVSDASDGVPYDTSDAPFVISSPPTPPEISLNRTSMYFGASVGEATATQNFLISNAGEGTLNWIVSDNAEWLSCSPTSGVGAEVVSVTVDASGLRAGTYHGTITVSDPQAINSPQAISVTLTVYAAGGSNAPFGVFDTPTEGSTVYGNIPVTGWALDDVEVEKVEVKREPVASDPPEVIGPDGLVYIGDAVFVEGARPDVEAAYPNYPLNYRAGWGYMMLTNSLPNSGNGEFTIYAIAYDKEGHKVTLGTKTITCDNANSEMPFGTIDTPLQGGTVSGNAYVNFGWALTPQPKYIPTDGSTIWVFIDGVPLGHPVYNNYRADIATLFPGYANSDGAVGFYLLDTTAFDNGVHNIAWSVTDSAGKTEGIGSRYFNVFNASGSTEGRIAGQKEYGNRFTMKNVKDLEEIIPKMEPVYIKKGFNVRSQAQEIYPNEEGVILVEITEVERLAIALHPDPTLLNFEASLLNNNVKANQSSPYEELLPDDGNSSYIGYLKIKNELRPLPIGSTLDSKRGVFYWQPGAGFIGDYELVFLRRDSLGYPSKQIIWIRIKPKF